jgi:flagellar biosynthesis protein FliP
MSIGAYFGMLAALTVVLLLLGIVLAALRRFTERAAGGGGMPLQVVQRVALSPKQGIAVVRIGERVVAVSVGEGGVRPVLELGETEARETIAALPATPPAVLPGLERLRQLPAVAAVTTAARATLSARFAQLREAARARHGDPAGAAAAADRPDATPQPSFRSVLRSALRSAALLVLLSTAAAGGGIVSSQPLHAQMAPGVARVQPAPGVQPLAPAPGFAQADTMITRLAPQIDLRVGQPQQGGLRLSGTVGIVVMMGLLTLLPTLLLLMTSFTRILVVLHFLRQALGTQSAPPAHLMAALALLLTGFVMAPTLSELNQTALQPWMEGRIEQGEMMELGAKPFREFMLAQTRERDLATFLEMRDEAPPASVDDIPLVVVVSAFVTSELRTAFQIGFALFLPFIIIDVVVASVLMSMGMFMLPPAMISLPFKLLLFVLVDGWSLIVQGLVTSFR